MTTRKSAVEIEVLGRALLEPEAVVVRCVLEELGSLLEDVIRLGLLTLPGNRGVLGLHVVLDCLAADVGLGLPGRRRNGWMLGHSPARGRRRGLEGGLRHLGLLVVPVGIVRVLLVLLVV